MIKNLPQADRPREKLLQKGPTALSDSELLAILLRQGTAGQSAISLAQKILEVFGGITNLFRADLNALTNIKGVGTTAYTQLQAAFELAQRARFAPLRTGMTIQHAHDAVTILQSYYQQHQDEECIVCLFLDSRLKLINLEVVAQGTTNESTLYPRLLVKRILHHNATSVILAHNHPSGSCEPSKHDIALTHQLHGMLSSIDVDLLDHIIVTTDQCYSIMLKTVISEPDHDLKPR